MPYPRVEPASDADLKKQRYLGHHSVCEKIREIYRMTDNQDIKFKCREAMAMTKRMHEKLKEFKAYRESGENQETE